MWIRRHAYGPSSGASNDASGRVKNASKVTEQYAKLVRDIRSKQGGMKTCNRPDPTFTPVSGRAMAEDVHAANASSNKEMAHKVDLRAIHPRVKLPAVISRLCSTLPTSHRVMSKISSIRRCARDWRSAEHRMLGVSMCISAMPTRSTER